MSNDVAIIGVGMHPFGRFGDKPAMVMAARHMGQGWPLA